MDKLRIIIGNVARGSDLFGREAIIEYLWTRLRSSNVLLAAPRRFGKTSVMYHLIDYPRAGFRVFHFDLESVTRPVDFVVLIIERLREDERLKNFLRKSARGFRTLLEEVELKVSPAEDVTIGLALKRRLENSWKEIGKEIFSKLETTSDPIVLIFDELGMMIENFLDGRLEENEIREFFNWFRSLRIDPKMSRCHYLIGSSISIDRHLSRLGIIATLNDFERIILREFDDSSVALTFLDGLLASNDIEIDEDGKARVFELLGPAIPYFIQALVSQMTLEFDARKR